ncbi:phage tail tube protein [Bradyrhizobium japonicum]|uniref:phage tail tube protein n=1 Tax=Bradyrhizobium japonicum TaxID=375 RepID=UPI0004096724|nr:phage tail tube protein [Bradyrhizobium japonicum]
MATSNRIGGVLSIRVDGRQLEARGNFSVTPSKFKRTGIAGQDFVHGYVEEPIVPSIKGDLSIGNQLSMVDLENITNATVQCALANGVTYVLTEAWTTSAFAIDAHDGKVEVTFEGVTCEEIT